MKQVRYLYSELAGSLDAYKRCVISQVNAIENHKNHWRDMSDMHCDRINKLISHFMPSGSGWDLGTKLDFDNSHADKLVFYGSYHHMTEGCYSGWSEHSITATPSFIGQINLRISGRNLNDIKEYLHEMFYTALTQNISNFVEDEVQTARMKRLLGQYYKRERKSGFLAAAALRNARTRIEWERYNDDSDEPDDIGAVRLRIVPDEHVDFEDLCGDTYNPDVNDDIKPEKLAKEKQEFRERVNRMGVWGIIGEYWTGETWEHADSCWGFVGDDWKESGYDVDIMQATLDAAAVARGVNE